jgi:hypothetical protein
MVRSIALVILALVLNAVPLHAQSRQFTVTVSSATVHKGPALTSPGIGHAPRHTVLKVLKQLGSWNAVLWTDSPNGLGYVHITTGRLGVSAASSRAASTSRPASPRPVAGEPTAAPAPRSTPAPAPLTTTQLTPVGDRVPSSVPQGGSRISHVVGVGGMVGSMSSWGVTGRWWQRDKHLGIQAAFTRDAMTSDVAPGRVTSIQIEPAVVYAPYDYVPGYVWLRPYVGSGLSFRRQTLKDALGEPVSDRGVGFHVFGGTELTFAGVTRFGLSAEAGYRHQPAPFAGFEPDRFALAIAGHWYIK